MWFALFKLYVYFYGVRFYKLDREVSTSEFRSAQFETVCGREIQFHFHKEEYDDFIYKRGKVRNKVFTGYIVRADLSDELPNTLTRFNNLKIVFNQRRLSLFQEKQVCDFLLLIFLEFLKKELEKTQ